MASIKISSLPKMDASKLSMDDMFIVNDGNSATTILTYQDMLTSITSQPLNFTGSIEFSGNVTVTGDASMRNVYTAEETDKAIADGIAPVEARVTGAEDQITLWRSLLGTSAGGYTMAELNGPQLGANTTVLSAINFFDTKTYTNTTLINGNATAIANQASSIAENTNKNVEQDGRLDILEEALKNDEGVIDTNDNAIKDNTDNILALATAIGIAVGDSAITYTESELTNLTGDYTAAFAIYTLDTIIVSEANKQDEIIAWGSAAGDQINNNLAGVNNVKAQLLASINAGITAAGSNTDVIAALTAMSNYITTNLDDLEAFAPPVLPAP